MELDYIKKSYHNLKKNLSRLIDMEKIKSFPDLQLNEWVQNLQQLNLDCPCSIFGYDIEKDNCPFYKCKDLNEECYEECDRCEVSCDYCLRTSYWSYIKYYSEELDYYQKTNIWNLYSCLYLAKELQQIRDSRYNPNKEISLEVSDFQFIKDKFKE